MRIHAKVCSHLTHMSVYHLFIARKTSEITIYVYLWKSVTDTNKMTPKIGKGAAPSAKQRVANANTYTQICYLRRIGCDILSE